MKRVRLIIISNIVVMAMNSQGPGDYSKNIVKFDFSDYGFILGSNSRGNEYYLVRIGSKGDVFEQTEGIRFDRLAFKDRRANKLEEFYIEEFKVGVYSIDRNALVYSEKGYVTEFSPLEDFKTLYDGNPGERLVVEKESTKLHLLDNQNINDAVLKFKFEGNGFMNAGMPIINGQGYVVAITASRTLSIRSFSAISIKSLRKKLMEIESQKGLACTYFNFLKNGEERNPCEQALYDDSRKRDSIEMERKARKELDARQAKAYRHSKINSWTISPTAGFYLDGQSIFTNENSLLNATNGNELSATKTVLGINIYVAPDSKKISLSLRPRYTTVSSIDTIFPFFNGAARLDNYKYNFYELPVFIEYGSIGWFGIGYSPGLQTEITYELTVPAGTSEKLYREKTTNVGGYVHTVYAMIGAVFFKRFRFDMIYSQQLGGFKGKDYSVTKNNIVYKPFSSLERPLSFIGLEMAYRMRGVWGYKNKTRPSQFVK